MKLGSWAELAVLEIKIFRKLHRTIDGANEASAHARTVGGFRKKRAIRYGKMALVVLGVGAGVAGLAGHGMGWSQTTVQGTAVGNSGETSTPKTTSTPSASAPAVSTIRVTSREIVVDVTATDDKGRPVHNLKQSDFIVKEDGKPQTVRSFQEITEDKPPVARSLPALPPNVYTNAQPTPATSAVNIILIDTLNASQPVDQVDIRKESIKYIQNMPRGTRVAVLGLSSRLRVLQGFTSDPAILIAAVDSKKNRALPSPFADTDASAAVEDQADEQVSLGNDDVAARLTQFENEMNGQQQDTIKRMTLEALNQIAAYVYGIKGRKNLIWFTDGIPLSMSPSGGTNDLVEITDYQKDLRKTTDLLTAAEVAVYPVDARKLFGDSSLNADQHLARINVHTAATVNENRAKFQQKTDKEHLSMEAVAQATGGVAYYNTNDLKAAVGKAIENGANYYSVSYNPPDLAFDGKYHAIHVESTRSDVHLAYRQGYNNDDIQHNAITPMLPLTTTAPEPYESNMVASMGRGVPTSSQVLFDVAVTPSAEPVNPNAPSVLGALDPKLAGKPLVRYDVQYFIPAMARQITFSESADGTRKGSLEFDLAAYDVYGKRITGLSQIIKTKPLTVQEFRQFIQKPFLQQVDLPPGEVFLRVGILDAISDKVGTLEIPLIVKKRPASSVVSTGGKGGS